MCLAVGPRCSATEPSRAPFGSKRNLLLQHRGADEYNSIEGRPDGGMKGDFGEALGEECGGMGRRATKCIYQAPLLGKTVTREKAITKPKGAPKAISHRTLFPPTMGLINCSTENWEKGNRQCGRERGGPRGTPPSPQHILLSERIAFQVPGE